MPSIFRKPLAIDKGVYAMSMDEARNAEITMYGQIVARQPTNWWGDPIPGDYIIQSEFLADLDKLSHAKALTIRMNSLGGDAGVSILIHNRLRDLAAKGMVLTCIVDGVAMSGGSLIMAACDTVRVDPSSLIMIHKCWETLWGGYNADELREEAAACEAWDKAQVSIYKRKCSLDEAEITRMMAATTYMTGQEAIDKGFADTLLEDAQPLDIAASADGRSLFVRGREFHLCPGMFAPDDIPTAGETDSKWDKAVEAALANVENFQIPRKYYRSNPEAKAPVENTPPANDVPLAPRREEITGEGGNPMEENKTQTSAVQEPTPAPAVDLAAAERKRLQEIDAIAALYDPALVQEAKYGENPCTAQELAYRAAVEAAAKAAGEGKAFMAAMSADTQASGAAAVSSAPAPTGNEPDEDSPQAAAAAAKADVAAFQKMKEVR